jgi:hypothetical protein
MRFKTFTIARAGLLTLFLFAQLRLYNSSFGNACVSRYTLITISTDSCQTLSSR